MSYGLRVRTAGQELLIDENYTCPQFIGKATLGAGAVSVIAQSGYSADQRSVTYPAGTTADSMVFWTLPESTHAGTFYCFEPRDVYGGSGYGDAVLMIYPTTGGGYSAPEGYVFNLGTVAASGESYGLRVRDGSGVLKFDSGQRHLQLKLLQAVYNQSITSSEVTTTLGTLPAKPAFMFSTHSSEIWTPSGQSSNGRWDAVAVKRTGNVLTSRGFLLSTMFEDAAWSGTITFGSNSGALPIINAAIYD